MPFRPFVPQVQAADAQSQLDQVRCSQGPALICTNLAADGTRTRLAVHCMQYGMTVMKVTTFCDSAFG